MASFATIIDDNDPRISYTGTWELNNSDLDSNDYSLTRHGTHVTGSQARLLFNGSSIMVYGSMRSEYEVDYPSSTPISLYSVDGSPSTLTTDAHGGKPPHNYLLYSSHNLSCGHGNEHTLDITYMLGYQTTLWLDYVQIVECENVVGTTVNLDDIAMPSSTPAMLSESSSRKEGGQLLKGILAAVTIGSTVIIIFSILVFYILRQRRKSKGFGEHYQPPTSLPLQRGRALRPFRLAPRQSILTPFLDLSNNRLLAEERHGRSRELTGTSHYARSNVYGTRLPPVPVPHLQEGYVTQGGSFRNKYARVRTPALGPQRSRRISASGGQCSRPGPSHERMAGGMFVPNLYRLEEIANPGDRTPPPAYRTV